MRCARCGKPLENDAFYCAECAGAPLVEQFTPVPADVRWKSATAWMCAITSLWAILVFAPLYSHSGTLRFLVVGAILTVIGTVFAVGAAVREVQATASFPRRSTIACLLVLLFSAQSAVWVYGNYRDHHAKSSPTLMDLKQLALAMQTYAEDNGGRLPGVVRDSQGRLCHNVWDQQIAPYLNHPNVYDATDDEGDALGVRSPSRPDRVLSFAMNGLLLTRPKGKPDGRANWSALVPAKLGAIVYPASTILLAEVATEASMGAPYTDPPRSPLWRDGRPTRKYERALSQWIDIDPRAWVETSGPVDSYDPGRWDAARGVARALHGGGGCYAFCDGHVKFMRIKQSVVGRPEADGREPSKADPWSPGNEYNAWLLR